MQEAAQSLDAEGPVDADADRDEKDAGNFDRRWQLSQNHKSEDGGHSWQQGQHQCEGRARQSRH